MDRFQEHWRFSSASSTGAAEMYRRSSSTYRNRAHWLAGAGQRRGSLPWPLFPVSPARTLEYLEPSSVRHRERAPTGPAPLPLTSTRGAKSKQFLARRRRRRAAATPGRRSLPRQQARRVVALGSAFASCCRCNRDRWTAAVSRDMAALRLNDARRTGGEDAQELGVDGISFTVHPFVLSAVGSGACGPDLKECTLTWSFSCLAPWTACTA